MTTISDKLTSIYNAKKDIKSAITEKGQSVGDNILDYASAIRNIEQGSGGSPSYRNWWKVYFIDYDGTVLSYQEVNDGDDFVFPDAPDHTDKFILFTGWNQTSNHTTDYDPQDLYTIVIGALYDVIDKQDTGENTKLMFNAHSITMTTGFALTSTVADGITIDWGDGTTTTSSSTSKTEYTHTYDRSYLGKDITVEIQCADGNTYDFYKVKTGLDNIMPTNVKFGKGCRYIVNSAFKDCYSLQSVSIPSSVTYIGSDAFQNCYSLQSVSIPSSVTYIGYDAFQNCYSLQSVSIPSSVTRIYNYAFQNCYSLQSLTIPSSVTTVDIAAFSGCSSLQSVTIPSSVTSIDSDAFYNCSSLQSVTIPSSVTSIDSSAFSKCYPSLYNKHILNVYNPNSVYNVVEVETDKVSSKFVNSVTIPSSVTTIGGNAFQSCYSLQSVTIPSSVTTIKNSAFKSCQSLQSLTIPSSVTTIGEGTFMECQSLQSLTIPSSVTTIKNAAFQSCYSLQSVSIPSSVSKISAQTFENCYSLQSVNIPESVTYIDGGSFGRCYSLKSITIPESVTTIKQGMLQYCYSLQSVSIPSSVTSVVNSLLYNCYSLQSVSIPSSVTSIDTNAFNKCYSLQSVSIPSSVVNISGSNVFANTNCIIDFGNERITVPTLQSTNSIGSNFCIVPDALYDTWCAATNWSTMTNKIIKYSDYHK